MARSAFSLLENEHLLWSGRPSHKRVLRSAGGYFILILALWFGWLTPWGKFSSYGEVLNGWWAEWPNTMILPVIILVLIALIFGERLRTFYALTEERALVHTVFLGRRTTSIDLRSVQEISVKVKKDGSGNITFGPSAMVDGEEKEPPCFKQIEDVLAVHTLILQAKRELKAT